MSSPKSLQFSPSGFGLLAGWSMMIFALSSVPGNHYPVISMPHADKIVHFGLYLPLGFFAAWFFRSANLSIKAPVFYGLLYAASDEFHQLFVPRRTCSFADWCADAVGTLAGIGIYLTIQRKLNSTKRRKNVKNTKITESLELS